MKPYRRFTRLWAFCALAISTGATLPVQADEYPSKPVQIITQAAAGNGPDVIGRIVADRLSQMWGQPALMINRPGAGGLLAAQAAVAAKPDGYTLYQAVTSSLLVLPVTQKLSFDLRRDMVPIGIVGEQPFFIASAPSLGITSLADLIVLAKKRPGEILFSAGVRGSMPHLASELFRDRAGVNLTFVPYPSTAQGLHDIMGGRLSVIFESLSGLQGALESGALKPLAVTSAKRLPNYPDVPTVAEIIPEFSATGWFVLMAQSGTPEGVIQKVSRDLEAVLKQPDLQKRFESLGTYVHPMSPTETAAFIVAEQKVWQPIARKLLSESK